MRRLLLTTVDNKFDPFTQFDDWYGYDILMGYNTLSVLAAEAKTSSEMSEQDYVEEVNRAVNYICKLNVLGLYKAVSRDE